MTWNNQMPPVPDYGVRPQTGAPVDSAAPPPAPQPVDPPAQVGGVPAPGAYAARPMASAQPVQDSDRPDADDDIWIERSKQAIAETQNDPYRQVQLLQHLSVLYLKERFNREVRADKD